MNQQEENFDNINFAETKEETDKKCPQCGGIIAGRARTNRDRSLSSDPGSGAGNQALCRRRH